jgi:hypothetical protein
MALIAWWKLDATSGTSVADSAGAYTGTASGGFTWHPTTGRIDGALEFNGTTAIVDFGTTAGLLGATRSYAWWTWCTSITGQHGLLSRINSTAPNDGFLIEQQDAALRVFINGGTPRLTAPGHFVAAQWIHTAVVMQSSVVTVYRNGISVGSGGFSGPTEPSISFYLGRQNTIAGRFFGGWLDDVRVYNHALTSAEITALAAPESPTPMAITVDAIPIIVVEIDLLRPAT